MTVKNRTGRRTPAAMCSSGLLPWRGHCFGMTSDRCYRAAPRLIHGAGHWDEERNVGGMTMRQTGLLIGLVFLTAAWGADGYAAKVSPATDECIGCHISISPGIVADWERSRHAETSPGEALKQSGLEKKVSSEKIPEQLLDYAVGCSECHTMNYDKHQDTFEHNGYDVHMVVTPGRLRDLPFPGNRTVFPRYDGACLWESCAQQSLSGFHEIGERPSDFCGHDDRPAAAG